MYMHTLTCNLWVIALCIFYSFCFDSVFGVLQFVALATHLTFVTIFWQEA